MKVVCPECSATFDVPMPILGEGRRVRCGSCRHEWFQEPVTAEATFGGFRGFEDQLDVEPIPASVHPHDHSDTDEREHDSGPSVFAMISWGYLGRMVGGFALGVFLLAGMMAGFAKMGVGSGFLAPFYQLVGMGQTLTSQGLEIQDVTARNAVDGNGQPMTEVKGRIVNTASDTRSIPAIDIIPAMEGIEHDGMRINIEQHTIKPQESVDFTAQREGALEPGSEVRVRFVN